MPATTPIQTPEDRQAQINENALRLSQGLGELQGIELDRHNRRRQADVFRQEQLGSLEQALSDRAGHAQEVEDTLLRSGLSSVADRFQRSSRRQAFNAARRGLGGGSADVQQQIATEAKANQEAEQAAADAAEQGLSRRLSDIRGASSLQGTLAQADPFSSAISQSETAGARQNAELDLMVKRLQAQQAGIGTQQQSALGGILGGAIGGAGGSVAQGLLGGL